MLTLQDLTDAITSLSQKKTSVGPDEMSNHMLKHLPDKWVQLLFNVFEKYWMNGNMRLVWKIQLLFPFINKASLKMIRVAIGQLH